MLIWWHLYFDIFLISTYLSSISFYIFSKPFVPNMGIELFMSWLFSKQILAQMPSYIYSTQWNLKYLCIRLPSFRPFLFNFECDVMRRYKHEKYWVMALYESHCTPGLLILLYGCILDKTIMWFTCREFRISVINDDWTNNILIDNYVSVSILFY